MDMVKKWRWVLVAAAFLFVFYNIFFRSRNVGENTFVRENIRLTYSAHARCRMKCRQITQEEIAEVLKYGKINFAKSDLDSPQCPRYAVEGRAYDGQELRIIFAQCNDKTIVVTAIDLNREYECHCK